MEKLILSIMQTALQPVVALLTEIRDSLQPQQGSHIAPHFPDSPEETKNGIFVAEVPEAARIVSSNGLADSRTVSPAETFNKVIPEQPKWTREQVGEIAVAVAKIDVTKARAALMPYQVNSENAERAAMKTFPSVGNIDPTSYPAVVDALKLVLAELNRGN